MTSHETGRAGLGILALVGTIVVVTGLDHPALGPSVADLGGWMAWAVGAGPVGLVMGVVRVAALGLSWYLLIASVLAVLAHVTRARSAVALAAIVSTGLARDLVLGVVGTGLLATIPMEASIPIAMHGPTRADGAGTIAGHPGPAKEVGTGAGAHLAVTREVADHAPAPSRTAHRAGKVDWVDTGVRLRRLPAAPPTTKTVSMVRLGPDATDADVTDGDEGPRMQRLDDEGPAGHPDAADPDVGRFTVAPGDHFWRIAEAAVAAHRGRDPAEHHVRDYWLRLVEANRDLLVDPGNADLLLPGQVLRLPRVDGEAAT